ncbi:MAG: ATP-binding protein, partial [Phaeodactylibacter sp.]|nr:ATP-binding protein [Phaeodactylibacter sp.]
PKAQNEQLVLNEVVTSVYHLFTEHQEPAENIQLLLPEQPIKAFTDKKQLARVLTNLVKNAQQSIPEGRPGQIAIQLYQQNGASIVKVSDNGTGIPEEVQPKVFQPNFTTKSSGMGLGLAMCKDIIEAAGGRLYFETRQDEGTNFFLELPEAE